MELHVTKSERWITPLLVISLFITQLDSGIISTNLSSMARELMLAPAEKSWIVSIYTLGLLFATPIMGSLIDRFGYRMVFLTELVLYFLGVLGIAFSQTFQMLLVFRALQAFGSSSLLTLTLSMVFANTEKKIGGKVGNIGSLVALSTIVAPLVSVLSLIKTHNWRSIYFVMAVLIAIIFLLAFFIVPKVTNSEVKSFDIKGNSLFVLSLLTFNLLLTRGFSRGHTVELMVYAIILILSSILLVKIETSRENEELTVLFSRRLWQIPTYRASLFGGITTGLVMSLFAFLPSFMEMTFHFDARKAGSLMTIMAIGTFIGSKVAGIWTDKKGANHATKGTMMLVFISLITMYFSVVSFKIFLFALLFFGLSIGALMTVPLQVLVVEASPKDRNASLSLLSVVKKLGMTIGITIIGVLAHATNSLGFSQMLIGLMIVTLIFIFYMRKKA
ncbi:MFS transporter [Enterococcus saccharolyticus]|uniref:MFS transporter n=1 Tax=Enterococcus TaxID=1350 RepID=UPI001E2A3B81|nr:MFS transporter [Enterococcus saccharolyticus]MCD5003645.1 MFS transporter [Enterococcus saccharolyticus]